MSSKLPAAQQLEYGSARRSLRRRIWRFLRVAPWILAPILIYAGVYFAFAERSALWGGGFVVKYPGMIRFYAMTPGFSISLGQSDELIEKHTDTGGSARRLNDSLLFVSDGWWHHLWRAFYPAERIELAFRHATPLQITYPRKTQVPSSTAPQPVLPFTGPVYHEWFVRDGRLLRFVEGVYEARGAQNTLLRRNDVYLFDWPLDGEWTDIARNASRVRLVETNSRVTWDQHWMVDPDQFITWNENTGDTRLLAYGTHGQAARVTATIPGLRPVRCNALSPITVSSTGRYFAGEKDGLTIYRGDSFKVERRILDSSATQRFFQSRTDELDSRNSLCHLMDDGITLLRTVTIFKTQGDKFVNGTTIVSFNVQTGEVRDIPVKVGLRADVHQARLIDGKVWLYLTYTTGKEWKQCLFCPDSQQSIDLHPQNMQPDSAIMGWDASQNTMVDLPGFTANPQPLMQDSEVCVEIAGTSNRILRKLRYADANGKPDLFTAGVIRLRDDE